jgi:hypothetical protein
MNYTWYDFVGNVGVSILLITYLLLQMNRLKSSDLIFSSLNGLGATLIIISLISEFNLSAFFIELFWLLISIYGIGRYINKLIR